MFCTTFALAGCTQEEQPKTYTINFIVEGETWKTLTSDKIEELTNPTKQYCDFAYWEFDVASVKDNCCDVYAKFTLNSRYQCLEVLSNSMNPVMERGEYVIVDTQALEYNVGDIVAFRYTASANISVHRITAIEGNTYTTKGDANVVEDAPITSSQIIGLVCENIGSTLPEDVVR